MNLSNVIVKEFAKSVTADNNSNTNSNVRGTIVSSGGSKFVRIDGSDALTPISEITDAQLGDRVLVTIENHSATIIGNYTYPTSARATIAAQTTANEALSQANYAIVYADNVVAGCVKTDELEARVADIGFLKASELNAELAILGYVKADELEAKVATFGYATVDNLDAAIGRITTLESTQITTEQLNASYANIDFANIGEAALKKIYSETGLINNLVVSNGSITGDLAAVNINGDLIKAGTIVADKLVVKGTDGILYKLNVDAVGLSKEEAPTDTLHGSIITAKSIVANKVDVDDLVAFGATIGGFNITTNSIYSGVKKSISNTTTGIYLDTNGQMALGDGTNYLKYYKDSDNYLLKISGNITATEGKIGGFNIGKDSLYSGVNSIMKANGVYLGTDGISCGNQFKVTADGRALIRWYDEVNEMWLRITIGDDVCPLAIEREDDPNEILILTYWGIYRHAGHNLYFSNSIEFNPYSTDTTVGTYSCPSHHHYINNAAHIYSKTYDNSAKVNLIYLSSNDKIHIGADNMPGNLVIFHNNIAFESRGTVGTEANPSGNHYLSNARYVYGLNTSGDMARLIGISSNDNLIVGNQYNTNKGVHLVSGYQQSIKLQAANSGGTDAVDLFYTTYHSTIGKMVIYAPVINDNTTSSNSANLIVGSTGILYKYVSSSKRYKEAISETLSDSINPNRLYELPVVEYIYKEHYLPETDVRYKQKFIGFIAEDVEDIYPLATNYNEDGSVESWNTNVMVPAMLKLIQDQHKVDLELASRINDSNVQIEHLRYQLEQAMLEIAYLRKEIDILKAA